MLADALRAAALGCHKPLVANWAPELAAAATALAPRSGISELDLGLDYMGVIDRETGGRNILGDGGNGHGLGQIDGRYHKAFLEAHANGLDPASNILYGMGLYVDNLIYVRRVTAAMPLPPADMICRRVAMAGYNAGIGRCAGILSRTGDPSEVDKVTTPGPTKRGDYGADVWRRRSEFAAHVPVGST